MWSLLFFFDIMIMVLLLKLEHKDRKNFKKGEFHMTNNKYVLEWIEKIKNIVNPDKVVWINGSEFGQANR